jgi:hypothetical protein
MTDERVKRTLVVLAIVFCLYVLVAFLLTFGHGESGGTEYGSVTPTPTTPR